MRKTQTRDRIILDKIACGTVQNIKKYKKIVFLLKFDFIVDPWTTVTSDGKM